MAGRKAMGLALVVLASAIMVPSGAAAEGLVPCNEIVGVPPSSKGNGLVSSPFRISSAEQLALITGDYLDCAYKQTASFTLPDPWTPIGAGVRFTGSYDGNGHTVKGLTITGTDDNVGLFGVVWGAEITDVRLTGVSVSGYDGVGGLAGQALASTITNVRVSGQVSGNSRVGGIVGEMTDGEIATSEITGAELGRSSLRSSTSTVEVSGSGDDVGGAVGRVTASDIEAVSATGNVTGLWTNVGGLIGFVGADSAVRFASASGAVSGGTSVGGLIGTLENSTLADSYSTGAVVGNELVGGLVGFVDGLAEMTALVSSPTLARTYASGAVTGSDLVGGLIGGLVAGRIVIDSYWNLDTNPGFTGVGGSDGEFVDPVGKTMDELMDIDTYGGWSIIKGRATFKPPNTVWGICDGTTTPYLLWATKQPRCPRQWRVEGFLPPVKSGDLINEVKAGKEVQVKWRLVDDSGAPETKSHPTFVLTFSQVSCDDWVPVVGPPSPAATTKSTVTSLGKGGWQYRWEIPKSFAGTCRTASVSFEGGNTVTARFSFRR